MTDFPRRNRIDQMTIAERAIYETIGVVEAVGADVRLTDAVVLLQAARNSVADFVDGVDKRRRVVEGEPAVAVPPETPQPGPPQFVIDEAVEASKRSPCRSKRGVALFRVGVGVIEVGYNRKPTGFECDGSATCKATCRVEAVHAEQAALVAAGSRAFAADMLHVKTVDGVLVASGGPSCVQCSKLAAIVRIAGVWLFHEDGWKRYPMTEFHALSLSVESVPPAPKPQDWQSMDNAPKGGESILVKVDCEEQEAVWAPFDGWRTRYSWVSIAPTMWKPILNSAAPKKEHAK